MADFRIKIDILSNDRASRPINDVTKKLSAFQEASKAASGSFQLSANLNQTADNFSRIGRAAQGFLRAPLAAAVNFEKKMVDVSAVSGASAKELAVLTAEARRLGSETIFSAQEAAAGMEELARSGFNTEQNLASMESVINLATASNVDLQRSALIASDLVRAFGLEASDTTQVVDELVAVTNSSSTGLEGLNRVMSFAGSTARTAGLSMGQLAAMAGVLADNNIKASRAGTGIRAVLSRLKAPTKSAARRLKKFGDATREAVTTGNFENIQGVLQEIDRGLKRMSPERAAKFSKKLFGLEAINAAENLMRAASEGTLAAKMRTTIDESEGEGARIAAEKKETRAGKLKAAQSRFQDLQIELGNTLAPLLTDLLETLTPLIKETSKWVKENPKLVRQLGSVLAKVAIFAPILGGLARIGSATSAIFGGLRFSMKLWQKGMVSTASTAARLSGLLGAGGLVAAAAGAGLAIGTLLDRMFGLSDFLAGVNGQTTARGSSRFQKISSEMTSQERARRQTLMKGLEDPKGSATADFFLNNRAQRALGVGTEGNRQEIRDELEALDASVLSRAEAKESRTRVDVSISDDRVRVRNIERESGDSEVNVDTGRQMRKAG